MNITSSKQKHGIYDNSITTTKHSCQISCKTCGRRFHSMKGYNVHTSNNKICMLNSTSDDRLNICPSERNNEGNEDICQQEMEDTFISAGNNEVYTSDDNGIAYINEIQSNFSRSNDSDDRQSICGMVLCSSSILNQWKDQKKRSDVVLSVDDIHSAKLAKILHTANAPLYLFDSIMSWASEATMSNYQFPHTPQSRKTLFKRLCTEYDLNGIAPVLKKIQLPCSGHVVEVFSFNIEQLLLSLLNNHELMCVDNLLFEDGDPFRFPKRRINTVVYVNSGSWYINAHKHVCQKDHDVLVPIIFFIDGVTIDMYSHLNLEPVTFTLGIFNRNTRNKAYAWRTLGFVNDLSLKSSIRKDEPSRMGDNLRDYHAILHTILSPLIGLQQKGGFKWQFHINGNVYDATCKVPVQFIIGDCKSQDVLCGRYGSHNCHSICRDCDCTFEDSDNPYIQCSPLKSSSINALIENGNMDALKIISFHIHENAFNSVCFGGDEYGINGATPPELLHEFRQGVFDICLDGFYGICNGKAMAWIDTMCQTLSMHTSHQSDRKFPRTSFPKGITSLSKITAEEKMGLLLILFLSMYKKSGVGQFCHPTFSAYRKLFHDLLVFHAFLFKEEHNTLLFNDVDKQIRRCMEFIKDVVDRHDGNGFHFPKFHQILHALGNICRNGSMRNFDGGPAECQGKTNAKQPSRLTQKRAHTFTRQSGERIIETLELDARLRDLRKFGLLVDNTISGNNGDACNNTFGGNKYIISFPKGRDGTYTGNIQWFGNTEVHRLFLSKELASFLLNDVIPTFTADHITCYTEYKRYGIILRAHPSYRSSQEWYDWAYINFYNVENDKNELCPSKICCFMKDECDSSEESHLLVIIQCSEPVVCNEKDDDLFPIVDRRILSEKYDIVDSECIDQACYAIPDIGDDGFDTGVIIVNPMDTWEDEYMHLNFDL